MNIYHIWCNLKEGVSDADFADSARGYFEHLKDRGLIAGYRITRRQLGLGPSEIPEFHLMLEFDGLGQLDEVFSHVASRAAPAEGFHYAVNSKVRDVVFALYRDFPDAVRKYGEEKF